MAERWGGSTARTARAYWRARLQAEGGLPCWRCGAMLTTASRWTVGHIEDRAAGGSVTDPTNQWPECARCNYSAGGRLGAAITNGKRRSVVAASLSRADRGLRPW